MKSPDTINLNSGSKRTFYMVRISVLAALSFILMFFEFSLPNVFPFFLEFDFSQIPVVIGTFSMGPISGLCILLIKDVLHLFIGSTQGVGELADFIVGGAFVLVSGFIYKYNKTRKGAIISMGLGTIAAVITGTIANYFIFIPLFAVVFNMPIEAYVNIAKEINPSIVDLKTLVVLAVAPFNLIKWAGITTITALIYKRVSPLLHMRK